MLNRMVELATQSANGTYDNTTDRDNLQKEVDQLLEEINRIADSANFNGINLLDGSMDAGAVNTNVVLGTMTSGAGFLTQTTANVPGTDMILHQDAKEGADTTTFEVSLDNLSFDLVTTGTVTNNVTLTVGGATITIASTDLTSDMDGAALAKLFANAVSTSDIAIGKVTYSVEADGSTLKFTMDSAAAAGITNPASFTGNFAVAVTFGSTGGDAKLSGSVNTSTQNVQEGSIAAGEVLANVAQSVAWTTSDIKDSMGLKVGDVTYVFALSEDTLNTNFGSGYEVIDMTDLAEKDETTGEYHLKNNDANHEYLSEAMGRISQKSESNAMFSIGHSNTDGKLTFQEKSSYDGDADLSTTAGLNSQFAVYESVTVKQSVDNPSGGSSLTLQIGDTSDSWNQLKVNIQDMHTDALGIEGLDISEQGLAQDAINKIKDAINTVSSVRGTLGATQNRLDHTINNLSVMTENIQDAESTIRDTDIAEEMMAYTKNNILVQSAQAMLAQANQVPQGVLQLLQ